MGGGGYGPGLRGRKGEFMNAHASAAGTVNVLQARRNASHDGEDHGRRTGFPNQGTHP